MIAGADFFTTEVWTWRGLVTFYAVFVIHLASRRVHILGSTPHPDEAFMRQVCRTLTMADAETCRVLICDRGYEMERAGSRLPAGCGDPCRTDTVSGAECQRSIKEECLDRIIPFGERHFRRAVQEIQKLAGWTSMRMLERYGHARDAELHRAVRVARTSPTLFRDHKKDHTTPRPIPTILCKLLIHNGVPNAIRTLVLALKGNPGAIRFVPEIAAYRFWRGWSSF